MKTTLAFFCNSALAEPSGRVSALGIFSSLQSPVFPFNLSQIALVLAVQGNDSDVGHHTVQINNISANGSSIITPLRCEFFIPDNISTINIIINFQNLLVPTPGEYVANVVVDDGLLIENMSLSVRKIEQAICN
jgi:hypothetical protein